MRILAAYASQHEGDFRDWSEIDGWAAGIAHDLSPVVAGRASQGA